MPPNESPTPHSRLPTRYGYSPAVNRSPNFAAVTKDSRAVPPTHKPGIPVISVGNQHPRNATRRPPGAPVPLEKSSSASRRSSSPWSATWRPANHNRYSRAPDSRFSSASPLRFFQRELGLALIFLGGPFVQANSTEVASIPCVTIEELAIPIESPIEHAASAAVRTTPIIMSDLRSFWLTGCPLALV